MTAFYVDTCIWLNLFKREGDPRKGTPYWLLAKRFIERTVCSQDAIVYSGIVLRELQIKLGHVYAEKRQWLERYFSMVDVLREDVVYARKLESAYSFRISYYDLIHVMIAKRLRLVLVTRDAQLLRVAREQGVTASRPEEL